MSTEEAEPPSKKAKADGDGDINGNGASDWAGHKLNISEAVDKAEEGMKFGELAESKIEVLQGIGPKSDAVLESMGVSTVSDLAKYKYYQLAKAIAALAETETEGGRPAGSTMNVDNAVTKDHETKTLGELLDAPVSAMEGLTPKADELLGHLGVKSIKDLANFKYAKWAEAIVELSKYEETKTAHERTVERELKKLA